ncbi:MAG: type II secretion system protein [Phycisphaerales bacterium]
MHATRKNKAKGFTLVEILIVVVILGILAAIVVPQFTNAANEARVGNVATQVSTIENQLELWAARNGGSYPDLATAGQTWDDLVDDGFFKEVPATPFDNSSAITAWDSTDEGELNVIYDDTVGWHYDAARGNIASGAPASAAP